MLTARMIRSKAADVLEIDETELEAPELKSLLNEIIEEHLNLKTGRESERDTEAEGNEHSSDEGEDSSTNPVDEIEDQLDDDELPLPIPQAKLPKRLPKAKKSKEAPVKNKKKVTKASQKADDALAKLKTYVFKCGVRKNWKKELEGLSEKQSIARVRQILEDLGMDGRPSLEKCKKIKDKREYEEEMRSLGLRDERKPKESEESEAEAPPARLDLSAYGDPDSD